MGKVLITPTRKPIKGTPVGDTREVTDREAKWLVKLKLATLVEESATPSSEPPQARARSTRRRKVAEPEEVAVPAAEPLDIPDVLEAPDAPDDPDYLLASDDAEVASTRRYVRRDLTAEG